LSGSKMLDVVLDNEMVTLEFAKRYAEYKTMLEQADKARELASAKGVDVRDTFHVVGIERSGDEATLRIVTSGEEGERYAKHVLSELFKAKRVRVENESVKRYDASNVLDAVAELLEALEGVKKRKGGEE